MRLIFPAIVIGLVGGCFDAYTDLHKVWCFLIGAGSFFLILFLKSIIVAASVMKKTKGAKKIWLDQNNNIIKYE